MISWPLALICIIATVASLIYVGCTSWYWHEGSYPATKEPKPLQRWRTTRWEKNHPDPGIRCLCAACSASRLDLADCDEPTTTH